MRGGLKEKARGGGLGKRTKIPSGDREERSGRGQTCAGHGSVEYGGLQPVACYVVQTGGTDVRCPCRWFNIDIPLQTCVNYAGVLRARPFDDVDDPCCVKTVMPWRKVGHERGGDWRDDWRRPWKRNSREGREGGGRDGGRDEEAR
eukprot:751899-Hanusia_phi.AAC.5